MAFFPIFAAVLMGAPLPCVDAVAIDGDTVKCAGGVKLRLTGIDAPEMPGHCRPGRVCVPGDPIASRDRLRKNMLKKSITYRPIKLDKYGRTVAMLYADGANLVCAQLRTSSAVYKVTWDAGRWVRKECFSGGV